MMKARHCNRILFAGSALWAVAIAGIAQAQAVSTENPTAEKSASAEGAAVPSAPAQDSQGPGGEIVVTGSRISRPGFSSPTPISTLTTQDLERRAPTNVADVQVLFPQLKPSNNTNGNRNSPGQATLDLRGLGALRTLVLLDGRRIAPTAPQGTIDVSLLPTILIDRIDTVTGGASAAYGSDAVSGVVNILLNNKLEGVKVNVQGGESSAGDYRNYDAAAAWGKAFGPEGRGHIVVAGDVYDNRGVTATGDRSWGRTQTGIITNPAYVAGSNNGQTRLVYVPGTTFSQMTDGGVIVAPAGSPLRGIQFGPGGVTEPFHYGNYVGTLFQEGGDGASFSQRINMSAPQKRRTAYGNVSYEFSDNVTAFANAFYAHSLNHFGVVPNYNNGDLTITQNNAFLPAQIKAIMVANNIQSFKLGRTNEDLFNLDSSSNSHSPTYTNVKTGRYAAGLNGSFGGTWKWEAYGQYDRNTFSLKIHNDRLQGNWLKAVNSTISPVTGQPICVSTLTDPNDGCVPVNLFGPNTVTQAVADYVLGTSEYDEKNTERVAAANIQGEPFSLWAGPISIATGIEYRHDTEVVTSDANSAAGLWRTNNVTPFSGRLNVVEGFLETDVPLAKDVWWAHSLDLNAAVRETHYSTSGSVTTWKVGLSYVPFPSLRFRGTVSRDIRAPNLNELFAGRTFGISTVIDRQTNVQVAMQSIGGGNPNLTPEIGKTYTGGFVFTPTWLSGFQGSIDYYNIRISGAIGAPTTQQVVDNCFNGQTLFCDNITRSPTTGLITAVAATNVNFQVLKSDGIDIDLLYGFPLDRIVDVPGRLTLHVTGTYVNKLATVANGVSIDAAGDVVLGVAHWRVNGAIGYQGSKLGLQALVRYVQGGVQNSSYVEGVDIDNNHVPARTYLDLATDYQISKGVQLFAKVDNVFNSDPPLTPGLAIGNEQAASNQYDRLGRLFSAGVRLRF